MEGLQVTIKGIAYVMLFNLNLFRKLGKEWGLDSLPETAQRLALIETLDSGSFEAYDVLFDVMYQAIACNEDNPPISKSAIENLALNDLVTIAGQMAQGIAVAFPQQNPDADPEKKILAPKKKKPGTT